MKNTSLALCALVMAISGCSGNSLNNPLITPTTGTSTPGTGTTPTTPTPAPTTPTTDGEITAATPVTVQEDVAQNMKSARVILGTNGEPETLLISMTALDTTPVAATWQRKPSLDTPGFVAFSVQEDPLDRLFVGLAAVSADRKTTATVAGDGGQFNKVLQGVDYSRDGAYTPPDATSGTNNTGQVSYSGKYAGLFNGGSDDAEVSGGTSTLNPTIQPRQPTRITGDVYMNANFADNIVNGAITNRVALDLDITTDINSAVYNDGTGVALEDVVMVKGDSPKGDILANGSFTGSTERPYGTDRSTNGDYGGVIGGTNGSSIAGGIALTTVYDSTGESIVGAIERGAFVLEQCNPGTATTPGTCTGTTR